MSVRYAKPIGLVTGGALLTFTSLLHAQEFRAPNFPSPPPPPIEQAAEQYSNSQAGFDLQPSSLAKPSHHAEQNSLLDQKLEHARQLRAQMERAGREQGASAEFAEKAYQAQQAYLAEQAFQEHQAFQKQLAREPRSHEPNAAQPEASEQYNVAQAGYQARPSYHMREPGNIPSTYSPPVHAAPAHANPIQKVRAPIAMSFGDQQDRESNEYYLQDNRAIASNPRVAERSPVSQAAYHSSPIDQQVARRPQPAQRVNASRSGQETPRYQQASYQQQLPQQRVPQQQTSYQQRVPHQQVAYQQAPRRQPIAQAASAAQPRNHQAPSGQPAVYFDQDFPGLPQRRVHGPNDPYILGEQSSVGLQDRIEELLTKPRYRMFADRLQETPQSTQAAEPKRFPSFAKANPNQQTAHQSTPKVENPQHQFVSHAAPPRRRRLSPQQSRSVRPSSPGLRSKAERSRLEFSPEGSVAQRSIDQRSRRPIAPVVQRSDSEVRLAYEMEQRIQSGARANPFQQVSRVTPAQDPFNDGVPRFHPESSPVASQPKFSPEGSIAQRSNDQRSRRPIAPITQRPDSEVRLAHEMEQRVDGGSRTNPYKQVSRVTPVQDPFNDVIPQFRPKSSPVASQPKKYRGSKTRVPAKQVSILSGRSRPQETDGSPFGFGAQDEPSQAPTEDFEPNNSTAQRSDDELKRIDDELNRRLEELDSELASEPGSDKKQDEDEDSRLDEMADEMEKDLAESLEELGDSVVDDLPDEPEDVATKPVEKSCEEFRSALLNDSIRDISLDISPPASSLRDQFTSIARTWTDRSGNVIATGSMVDLRRGYVILDGVDGRQKIPYAKLSEADLGAIADYWRLPKLCSVGDRGSATRSWVGQTYTWKASNLCHKPLFFEDVQLERYGHSRGPFTQPVHSVAHFFVSLATVPYQTAITPANECQYALGFYRPGNCAPWLKDPVPISLNGALRQVAVSGFGGFTR